MCGIAGLYHFDAQQPIAESRLVAMTQRLAHRGPDGEGIRVFPGCGLGHRRLSIIDLSDAGSQPMVNADQSVWIAYNGECYNYQALRALPELASYPFQSQSDTEVILALYTVLGDAFLERLQGIFALAIYDRRRHRLLVARDRFGVKPLHLLRHANGLSFASETTALIASGEVRRQINPVALVDYLYHMSVTSGQSILQDVEILAPGHCIVAEGGRLTTTRYWQPAPSGPPPAEPVEAFSERFTAEVRSQLMADVPVGVFLSGGIDSSLVALAAATAGQDLQSFALTQPGSSLDEAGYAAMVAQHCAITHHSCELSATDESVLLDMARFCDEPFAVLSAVGVYRLAAYARDHVRVVLTGDGADEMWAGYPWRHGRLRPTGRLMRHVRALSGEGSMGATCDRLLHSITHWRQSVYAQSLWVQESSQLLDILHADLRPAVAQFWQQNPIVQSLQTHADRDWLRARLLADQQTTMVSEMLYKADRMTMASGVEGRVPFLATPQLDLATSLPADALLEGQTGKRVLRQALSRYDIGREIVARPKQGFVLPLADFMRNTWQGLVRDALSVSRVEARGLFRADAVDRLVREFYDSHAPHEQILFQLLMLELWHVNVWDSTDHAGARS